MAYYTWKSYKLETDPLSLLEVFKGQGNCFLLDSSLNVDRSLGRYSFLGFDPFYVLETKGRDPFVKLKDLLNKYKLPRKERAFPFLGGAVGYLAYDLGFLLEEKLKRKAADDLNIPDCVFGFYNTAVIIDNLKNLLHIFCAGFPEKEYFLQKELCRFNLKKIERLVSQAKAISHSKEISLPGKLKAGSNFSRKGYIVAVNKAKEYIRKGDIYQVNLSQRFQAESDLPAELIYRRLRKLSPSYFSAYFDAGEAQILSSSPERFLSLEGDRVLTRPMKGTRRRGKDSKEDKALKKELINSAKDKAELTMIVDLERNDLGRACDYDSVKVSSLRTMEAYNTVYQTTATVEGRLFKDKDRIDLLRSCFPGGSITGCPKIRSMEIIDELEPNSRSIYTGSLGYLSFSGDMDFNILIRTILKKKDKLYFSVGGGIVADSSPEKEYEETLVKAKAMMQAIGG